MVLAESGLGEADAAMRELSAEGFGMEGDAEDEVAIVLTSILFCQSVRATN